MNRIASWELWGQHHHSQRRAVVIAIHAPEPDPKSPHGDYRTLVDLDGITKSRYGRGVNSMQSLVLAMQLLRVQIEVALTDGWQFYFNSDDMEPFDLLHCMSIQLGTTQR